MNTRRFSGWTLLVLAAALSVLAATGLAPVLLADDKPADKPAKDAPKVTADDIAAAIKGLSADKWQDREAAGNVLWKAGKAAKPALEKAAASGDREVAERAKGVLEKFRWGIYPDTPKEVVDLISEYRAAGEDVSGEGDGRQAALNKLLKAGKTGRAALAAMSTDAEVARRLSAVFDAPGSEQAVALHAALAAGKADDAADILKLGAACGHRQSACNLAALYLLSGTLDKKIAELAAGGEEADQQILVYLYRATGDLTKAADAAKKSGDADLLAMVWEEMGDWKALLAYQQTVLDTIRSKSDDDGNAMLHARGRLATYQRLAGDAAGCKSTIDGIQRDGDEYYYRMRMLMLNDLVKESLDLLKEKKRYPGLLYLLVGQQKYFDAAEIYETAIEEAKAEAPAKEPVGESDAEESDAAAPAERSRTDTAELRGQYARMLVALGEKEQAAKVMKEAFDKYKDGPGRQSVIIWEADCNLKEQARAHALEMMKTNGVPRQTPETRLTPEMFGDTRYDVLAWILLLGLPEDVKGFKAVFDKLDRIMDGKMPADDVAGLIDRLLDDKVDGHCTAEGQWTPQHTQDVWTISESCRELKYDAAAERCLTVWLEHRKTDPNPSRNAAEGFGRYWIDKKKWKQAAEAYETSFEDHAENKDNSRHDRAIAQYLKGYSIFMGGDKKQGQELMDRADLQALGEAFVRYRLMLFLDRVGAKDLSQHQADLMVKTAPFENVFLSGAQREKAALLSKDKAKKDFAAAALATEVSRLCTLAPSAYMSDDTTFLRMTGWCHAPMMKHYLRKGDMDKAAAEAQVCLSALPGDIQVTIDLARAYDKAGSKATADEWFNRAWDFHKRIVDKFPKATAQYNSLAWLSSQCRRNMEAGEKYARKAVELEPKSAGYLDTLAELRFQQGDAKQAIELMKKCIEIDDKKVKPLTEYLQGQLNRFEAGDTAVDPPEME